jgi:hypothetical protein
VPVPPERITGVIVPDFACAACLGIALVSFAGRAGARGARVIPLPRRRHRLIEVARRFRSQPGCAKQAAKRSSEERR